MGRIFQRVAILLAAILGVLVDSPPREDERNYLAHSFINAKAGGDGIIVKKAQAGVLVYVFELNRQALGKLDALLRTNPKTPLKLYIPDVASLLGLKGGPGGVSTGQGGTSAPKRRLPKNHLSRVILLRGMAMLANLVVVEDIYNQELLAGVFGVPKHKIAIYNPSTPQPRPWCRRRARTHINGKNGIYVLYSDSNVHVNLRVVNKRVVSILVRTVSEIPAKKKTLCMRGPYERQMYETFVAVSKNSVETNAQVPSVVGYKKRVVSIKTPSVVISIDKADLSLTLAAPKDLFMGVGLMFAHPRASPHKWLVSSENNIFSVEHPRLTRKFKGRRCFIYNRPRRAVHEAFDPPASASPLKRLLINADFSNSGFGQVSKSLALNMLPEQKYLVRCKKFIYNWKAGPQSFDDLVLNSYLCESDQKTPEAAFNLPSAFARPGVEIRNRYPIDLSPRLKNTRLMINFPWEFSQVPKAWINPLVSRGIDVIAPSVYNLNVHRHAGISPARLKLLPHGISFHAMTLVRKTEHSLLSLQPAALFHAPADYTRFVMVNGALARKGIDTAIEAFTKAFTKQDRVVLRIHAAYGDGMVKRKIASLVAQNRQKNGPRIVYTTKKLPYRTIRGLLAQAHFNLSPYKGEGFGLSVLEGMVFGTVPIVTNHGPALDFCQKQSTLFIPYKMTKCTEPPISVVNGKVRIFEHFIDDYPTWASPDINKLASILKHAHKLRRTRPKAYQRMRKQNQAAALAQDWSVQMKKLKKIISSKK
ncbi:hypothetical protein NEDG_01896 [Nematocida displodere]|uniref:Glycosyl transferase family 1 domain-containing protein n=1 Tax=Nematocida displodere TaxID=1805483 RepID=A0A177EJ17_9MICR|nr:hypothetical protein NEDG_01896 [Nematocida displodere]